MKENCPLFFKWQVLKTFVQKKVHIQFTMEPKPLWSRIDNQIPLRINRILALSCEIKVFFNSSDAGRWKKWGESSKWWAESTPPGWNRVNGSAKNWFRHHWIQFIQQFRFWSYCLFYVCDKNLNYTKKFTLPSETNAYFGYPKLR